MRSLFRDGIAPTPGRFAGWVLIPFLIAASPTSSRPVDENIYQAIAGDWLFASEADDGACVVTLSSTIVAGHHGVSGASRCRDSVGALSSATIWDLDAEGGLTFRDRVGKSLIRLSEDPDGQYYQPGKSSGNRLVLMAANEGSERLVRASEMPGQWQFQRPDGSAVCALTFQATPVAARSSFRGLSISPGCDANLRKLQLVKWHIEGALLVLVGSETADLTLVPKADGSFVKSAKEGGKPLILVHK